MEKLTPIDRWCHTKVDIDQLVYAWRIEQFSFYLLDKEGFICSSPFIIPGKEKIQWVIKIYPCGSDEESRDYLSVYLLLLNSQNEYLKASFQFSVLGKNSLKVKPLESILTCQFQRGKDWGFKKFIHHCELFNTENELLPNDLLTLFCEITMVPQPITVNEEVVESTNNSQESKHPVIKALNDILQAQLLTDVTFKIGKKKLKAHRYVLAARSEVFDAMFMHSEGERLSEIIEIKDTRCTVFEEMIKFIYTEQQPESLKKFEIEFLKAAEKYKLPRLKVVCENSLSSWLTVEKAAEMFIAADTYHAATLRQNALAYISSHAAHIVETEGYRHMLKHHPRLITEILHALATSCNTL